MLISVKKYGYDIIQCLGIGTGYDVYDVGTCYTSYTMNMSTNLYSSSSDLDSDRNIVSWKL